MARPICAHCGEPYGFRITTDHVLVWRKGEARPAYRGNGVVLRDRGGHGPTRLLERVLGRPKNGNDEFAFLDVWDGETWFAQYEPFCKLRCALDYAQCAYRRWGALHKQPPPVNR